MPKFKLSYFDFHGGRGESIRLAFFIGGIDFEDHRFVFADWPPIKEQTPFGSIPVLEVDGKKLTQSNTINRYVGRLTGLYPEDPWQAALADEVMDVVEELNHRMGATFGIKDEDALRQARQGLMDGPFARILTRLGKSLEERGDTFFADGRLTVADLKAFEIIRKLKSGTLDHVPVDFADRIAPALVRHFERVKAHPDVAAYYTKLGVTF